MLSGSTDIGAGLGYTYRRITAQQSYAAQLARRRRPLVLCSHVMSCSAVKLAVLPSCCTHGLHPPNGLDALSDCSTLLWLQMLGMCVRVVGA